MACVRADDSKPCHGRFAGARLAIQQMRAARPVTIDNRRMAGHGTWSQLHRRILANQLAPLRVILIRQQRPKWHRNEVGIAVIGLAIRVGELGAFHQGVHEFGAIRIHRADIEPVQQGELLQEHRSLTPRAALQNGVPVILVRDRVFHRRRPASKIVSREQAAMPAPRHIQHVGGSEELVHRLRHKAAIPGSACCIDASLTRTPPLLRGRCVRRSPPAPDARTDSPAPVSCHAAGIPPPMTSTPPRTASACFRSLR